MWKNLRFKLQDLKYVRHTHTHTHTRTTLETSFLMQLDVDLLHAGEVNIYHGAFFRARAKLLLYKILKIIYVNFRDSNVRNFLTLLNAKPECVYLRYIYICMYSRNSLSLSFFSPDTSYPCDSRSRANECSRKSEYEHFAQPRARLVICSRRAMQATRIQ